VVRLKYLENLASSVAGSSRDHANDELHISEGRDVTGLPLSCYGKHCFCISYFGLMSYFAYLGSPKFSIFGKKNRIEMNKNHTTTTHLERCREIKWVCCVVETCNARAYSLVTARDPKV
jgi:hypothetical protein